MEIKRIFVKRKENYELVMLSANGWHEGISDGLAMRCPFCGRVPVIDYQVTDEVWREVAPQEHRTDVICIDCFVELARESQIDISRAFEQFQIVTRQGQTVFAYPAVVFNY